MNGGESSFSCRVDASVDVKGRQKEALLNTATAGVATMVSWEAREQIGWNRAVGSRHDPASVYAAVLSGAGGCTCTGKTEANHQKRAIKELRARSLKLDGGAAGDPGGGCSGVVMGDDGDDARKRVRCWGRMDLVVGDP
jgi:hypothetical protein